MTRSLVERVVSRITASGVRIGSRIAPDLNRKRIRRWPVASIEGTDISMFVDRTTTFGQELLEHHERPTERFVLPMMRHVLRPADVYFDIGAHWGLYALVASRLVGPTGRCIAVEPYLPSFHILRENVLKNRCENLSTVHAAVGGEVKAGRLVVSKGGDNLNHLRPEDGGRSGVVGRALEFLREDKCHITTVAELMREHAISRIRMIKMDVEGGECVIAPDLVSYMDRVDCLLLEAHPPFRGYDCDLDLLYRWLSLDRELWVIDEDAARLERITSKQQFEDRLYRYYFVSTRPGECDFGGFHW